MSEWNAELHLCQVSAEYADTRKRRHTRLHSDLEWFVGSVHECIAPCALGDTLPLDVAARLRTLLYERFKRQRIKQLLKQFGPCGLSEDTVRLLHEREKLTAEDAAIYERWKAMGVRRCMLQPILEQPQPRTREEGARGSV
jgi:hypothetical protein